MSAQLPSCPATLKAIQHYLNTATEHDKRDPVVSYWCKYCVENFGSKDANDAGDRRRILK